MSESREGPAAPSRDALVRLLVAHLGQGKLPSRELIGALQAVVERPEAGAVRRELLAHAAGRSEPALVALSGLLRSLRLRDAQRAHDLRASGRPLPDDLRAELADLPIALPSAGRPNADTVSLAEAVARLRDRLFLKARDAVVPELRARVDEAYRSAVARLVETPGAWDDLDPSALVEEAALSASEPDAAALRSVLDGILAEEKGRARKAVAEVADGRTAAHRAVGFDARTLREAAVLELRQRTVRAEQQALLDLILLSPRELLADALAPLGGEAWVEERATLVLTLRFGTPNGADWGQWMGWLRMIRATVLDQKKSAWPAGTPEERLLLWYAGRPRPDAYVLEQLEGRCARGLASVSADELADRWQAALTHDERDALLGEELLTDLPGLEPPEADPSTPPTASTAEPRSVGSTPSGPRSPSAPPPAPGLPVPAPSSVPPPRARRRPPPIPPGAASPPEPPSPWREHVQGFLAENAYVAAGIVMVVVGASLLAYFTWDKHWLLRYTIMPGLLFAFTASLGAAASWLERRDATLRDTAATLRGAAALLLPVNFMALALLAGDPEVTSRTLALPVMAVVYLSLTGALLRSFCGGVEERLVPILPLVLLALNALVLLRPLSQSRPEGAGALVIGFHAGFFVLAGAVVWFTDRILDGRIAREARAPLFVAATLVLTYLFVFVLVHGPAAYRPPLHAYAALPVLAGGLTLLVERRFLELRGRRLRTESFLGYALVLLGVLMGGGDPWMRIVTLVLAGILWLGQAAPRREAIHHWIGMTFLVLGGASVGLLPGFPGPQLPWLGLTLGIAVGLAGALAAARDEALLAGACRGLQSTVLVLSTVVAVLGQWHYRSEPAATAWVILAIAVVLAFRAWRDESLPLVHTVAAHFALALPYLGFVDVGQRTLRGNTMAFGLAALSWAWIALLGVRPARLLREARSTVLFLYGVLALSAMTLRVMVEGRLTVDESLVLAYREHLGPLLMAGALVLATWWSRSLLPAGIAVVLLVILFPALKANLQATFPALGWGTGFGSAVSALGLLLLSFRLRASVALRRLEGGDLLLGQAPFPLRRFDHTLFTTPLLASAVYLLVRADTWTLVRHLEAGVPLKTALALIVSAAAWMLLAAYGHARAGATLLVHVASLTLFLGVWFAHERLSAASAAQWPIAITILVLAVLESSFRHVLAPRLSWAAQALADPLRRLLGLVSPLVSLAVIVLLVGGGTALEQVRVLALVLVLQLAASALRDRRTQAGFWLVGLAYVVLLAAAAPRDRPLLVGLGVDAGLSETLVLIVAVQLALALLEWAPASYEALRPVLFPAQVLVTSLALLLGILGGRAPFAPPHPSVAQEGLLLAGVLLTARAHHSGLFALVGSVLLYFFVHHSPIESRAYGIDRLRYFTEPLRLSAFALFLAMAAVVGRLFAEGFPGLMRGRHPFAVLSGPVQPVLHAAAVLAGSLAAARHTFVEELRRSVDHLAAPWLAAATAIVVGWFSGPHLLFWWAVVLTSLGNVHGVRLFWGEPLRGSGVGEVHLVVLGLGLTLLEGTVLRLVWRDRGVAAFVNRASLAVAGLVLTLLTTNYAAHPDLVAITPMRFVVSGTMALAAGLYFRRAARHPGPGEEAHTDLCEGLYHFGLASAVWCAALLVPWFRQPSTVLLALGVPALAFWVRAELEAGETGRRFRSSAAVLGFLLLGLYALRPIFQMVLFPETRIETDHYHYYSGLAMAVGLLLLRLHGLGGTSWLAFYGGVALITGSYFALTAWPDLSPFAPDPVPASWCALGLAHFWTIASARRSPLRGFLQRLAALEGAPWIKLRASWGRFVLAASQVMAWVGLLHASAHDTYAVAPLLLGSASVFIHHGALYLSAWRYQTGILLVALALHADFALPSYLRRDDVVWALLVLWALVLFVPRLLGRPLRTGVSGTASAALAALTMVQVFHHHASSETGLAAVALGALLAGLTPRDEPTARSPEETLAAALLLVVPTWLVYFSQAPLLERGPAAAFDTWAVLATASTIFLTGLVARGPARSWERSLLASSPRVFHHVVAFAARHGDQVHVATMVVATGSALLLQVARYSRPLDPASVVLFCALYISLAVAWYREGGRVRATLPYLAAEACLVLAFAVVRRQLMLTAAGWTHEHDIWVSLGVSLLLAGSKQAFDERPRELRVPFALSVLALPAIALVWTLVHGLGVDVAVLVVGLHSLMFAYLGRDRADSLYNLVATAGFVAFVLMVFWSKLELRALHAYVIPVGLGVLVLLQLFGRDLPADTRNRIRLVTLLAMLGSAAYYALVDDRHPLAFNLTLLALCLCAMALGSVMRIRLYLVLGLAGVLVDLASIVVKVLVSLDRGAQMTSVGLLVLLVGGGLVSGAIYYKTHRDAIEGQLRDWRLRFGGWE